MIKVKDNFVLKEMNGMFLVIAVGDAVKHFNGYLSLNETGCFLWKKLSRFTTAEQLIDDLLSEYDVSKEIASNSVNNFIKKLTDNNLLEEK